MQLYQVTSLNTSPTWYSNVSFFECRYINLVAEHILTTAPAICREFVTSGPSFFTGSRTIYRPDSSLRVVLVKYSSHAFSSSVYIFSFGNGMSSSSSQNFLRS
ncbi:uncharacterized protein LOC114354712 isoform X1 [Ostrinia furnacalis]|uniref:uncharacterized protein LOC114354712 isoform X1 n=1 Tax=Ostrinia furnacalis TaxID=93504 RepID=UPI001039E77E|nr:uncharacterized protein LOC114354712 isoform X1 [Ostrinia furnacalis]